MGQNAAPAADLFQGSAQGCHLLAKQKQQYPLVTRGAVTRANSHISVYKKNQNIESSFSFHSEKSKTAFSLHVFLFSFCGHSCKAFCFRGCLYCLNCLNSIACSGVHCLGVFFPPGHFLTVVSPLVLHIFSMSDNCHLLVRHDIILVCNAPQVVWQNRQGSG